MTKLKATERIDYFLSDLWDSGNNLIDITNKFLFTTVLIPIAIYTAVIIVTGAFFDSTYLPFATLFLNINTLWAIISLLTLPLIVPLITLVLIWTIIWLFIWLLVDFIKAAFFGNRKD
jgi:hypothetical protein